MTIDESILIDSIMIFIFSTLYIVWTTLCILHWFVEDLETDPLPHPIFTWFLIHYVAFIIFFLTKIL